MTEQTRKTIAELALNLLDTNNGVNETIWRDLKTLLTQAKLQNIIDKVITDQGRYFLFPRDADLLFDETNYTSS